MAVFPPADDLVSLYDALPPRMHLTHIDKWHVTLAFLGEVDDTRLSEVEDALSKVRPPGPFRLRLAGAGRFRTAAWAGIDGEIDRLHELQAAVLAALADFPTGDRAYTPHLTVAYHDAPAIERALVGYLGEAWTVTEFVLVRSRDGRYERVRSWPITR